MDLYVLSNRLRLVSFKKDHLPVYTHHLLKFLLFPTESGHFVSFTETDEEISLIMEDDYLNELLEYNDVGLEIEPTTWRALQLMVGTAGETETGIVSSLAKPLAMRNISIFQLSTYDSDYALVEEPKLADALAAVKTFMKVNVVLPESDENDVDLSLQQPESPTRGGGGAHGGEDDESLGGAVDETVRSKRNAPSFSPALPSISSTSPPKKHRPFSLTSYKIYLASIDRDYIEELSGVLTRLIFYSTKKRFFSFSRNGDQTSIILDDDEYTLFPEHTLNIYPEAKAVLRVADGPLGFEECGIVADFASVLADERISIFYMSTFLTDYLLIGANDSKHAVEALTRSLGQ